MFRKKITQKVIKTLLFITINPISYLYGNTIHENIQNFNNIVDDIYTNCADNDMSKEELESDLEYFYENPIDINYTSIEELEKLHILSWEQIMALQNHKNKYGPLISIYELQTIPEFDLKTIHILIPFVHLKESLKDLRNNSILPEIRNINNNQISLHYKRNFLTTEELKEWYKISTKTGMPTHLGSPDEIISKIRIRHPNGCDIGISAKKSIGEEFIWDSKSKRYGLNVYRAHFMIKEKGILKKLILGNYEIGYGQGLIISSGFSLEKETENIKVIKTTNLGIKPYTSPKGIKFCGIATTLQWNLWEFTPYYSFVNLDEKIIGKNTDNQHIESQLYRTCDYDSFSKVEKRNSLIEQVLGTTILYKDKKNNFELGSNFIFTLFNIPFWKKNQNLESNSNRKDKIPEYSNSDSIYDNEIEEETKNKFTGTQNINASIFYSYLWKNIHFFGEEAFSKNLSDKTLQIRNICHAFINGAVISLHKNLDTTLVYRFYSPAYNCFYGNPLKTSPHPKNEHAFYTGLRYKPLFELTFDAFYDFAYIPEPENGQNPFIKNFMVKTSYELYKLWTISLQYSQKIKDTKTTKDEKKSYDFKFKKEVIHKIRLKSKYILSSKISLKNEFHLNNYNKINTNTWGYGLIQDIIYRINNIKLTTRIGWFNPQTYKNTIYSYEPSLLNVGKGTTQYTKRGLFFCFLICYKPSVEWRIELKYSHFQKYEEENNLKKQKNKPYSTIDNAITVQLIYSF